MQQTPTLDEIRQKRREWVTVLRSGRYKQGQGALYSAIDAGGFKQGFCCIGVACDSVLGLDERITFESVSDTWDGQIGYQRFQNTLRVSPKTSDYFTWMNDGAYLNRRKLPKRRDFKFIARFAEIVFALDGIGIAPEESSE